MQQPRKWSKYLPIIVFNFGVFARVGHLSGFSLTVPDQFVDLDARDKHIAGVQSHLRHLGHLAVPQKVLVNHDNQGFFTYN